MITTVVVRCLAAWSSVGPLYQAVSEGPSYALTCYQAATYAFAACNRGIASTPPAFSTCDAELVETPRGSLLAHRKSSLAPPTCAVTCTSVTPRPSAAH